MTTAPTSDTPRPLAGTELLLGGIFLAIANFMAVLDMTVANVSVSHIAGSLAISPTEGTYVITSYAVAEAISVPLTGWLSSRFGSLKVFVLGMLLFGFFSFMCGSANSLSLLIIGRILQGLSGGPLMPLSQTLLMQIFPRDKQATALGLWSVTTLVAPVLGPVVGGYLCDNWGWPFIFFINIPIAIVGAPIIWKMLRRFETPTVKKKTDFGGLYLLIVWVSALQIMLDKGKELDWFESNFIIILAITALIGFAAFVIWELTEEHPIVDLRVFRHRGYTASITTLGLAFGSYFGTVVLVPLWLQNYMSYTATWSGVVSGSIGILSVLFAPLAAKLSVKADTRWIVFIAVAWLGIMTFARSFATTGMDIDQIMIPMVFQGIGLPFFFIPLTFLAMACVDKDEMASASGLMSFIRTLSGAFATSIVTTAWDDQTTSFHAELANIVQAPANASPAALNMIVQQQSVMLATNHIFIIVAVTFLFAATAIWLAPKPAHVSATLPGH